MLVLDLPTIRGSTEMPPPRPWDDTPEDDPEAPPDEGDGKT
jgi:hypothetical protein